MQTGIITVKSRRGEWTLNRLHVTHTGSFREIESLGVEQNEKARQAYEAIGQSAASEFMARKNATVKRAVSRVDGKTGLASFTMRAVLPKGRFGADSAFRALEGARTVARLEWKAAKLVIVAPVVLAKAA